MFSVQRLQSGDAHLTVEVVARVKDDAASPPVTEAYLTRFLADDSHYLMVAMADGGVVGFVLAYRLARIDRDQAVYLHEIDVLPAYRRRGIGTALMEEMLRLCRAEGILKLWLGTNTANTAAVALYEKTGGRRLPDDGECCEWRFTIS